MVNMLFNVIFKQIHRDSPPHMRDETILTEELILQIIQNVTLLLGDTFQGIPVLPVVGNHDYFPVNQLTGGQSSFYDSLAEMWDPWFNDTSISAKFRQGILNHFFVYLSFDLTIDIQYSF